MRTTCEGCGEQLKPQRRRGGPPRRWCSDRCRLKAYRAEHEPVSPHAPRRSISYATCKYCASLYVVRRAKAPKRPACDRIECRRAENAERNRLGKYSTASRRRRGRPASTRAADARRRFRLEQVVVEAFTSEVIFERDGWRCGICTKKVDRRLSWPHPGSATVDHIIPVAELGPHTRANVRCAHLSCNSSRRAGGGNEQLALIG